MKKKFPLSLKNSIGIKLLSYVFFFYLVAAFITTSIHMVSEYRRVKKNVIKEILVYQEIMGPAMAVALWDADSKQMKTILSGLMDSGLILGVELKEKKDFFVEAIGETIPDQEKTLIRDTLGLRIQGRDKSKYLFGYTYPLVFRVDKHDHQLGHINLFSSERVVFDKVKYGFFYILVNAIIKALILWGVFLWFSRKLLGKPLAILTEAASAVDMNRLERTHVDVQTKGHNELKILETAFNSMINNLIEGKREQHRLYSSLNKHKQGLEREVDKRTRELKSINEDLKLQISERLKVKDSLTESQRAMATLLANLPGMAYRCIYNENWTMEFISRGSFELTGYQPSELLHDKKVAYGRIIHPEDQAHVWDRVEKGILKKDAFRVTYRIVTASGDVKWVWEQGRGVYSEDGTLRFLEGFISDINDRKKAEDELAAEKERLRVTLQSIGDGVITTNIEGRVTFLNKVAEELTGNENKLIAGMPLEEVFYIVDEQTRNRMENPVQKVIQTGKTMYYSGKSVLISKHGREQIIEHSAAPIREGEERTIGVVLVFRDITEKQILEDKLRQSHKMEAIGTLAGGIAHDFNNILGIILGNAELAMDDTPEWSPGQQNLEEIKTASLRAKDVVRQLLSFSRKSEQNRKPLKIDKIIKESLTLMRASIPSTIEIRPHIPHDLPAIMADPTQIHQVMINLCTNASHAMEENGGVLTVNISVAELDSNAVSGYNDLKSGRYIKLTIGDTGHGIDPLILNKIFDPYFTTKGVGKGTGIGLAVVSGIVKNHEGGISISSDPGEGTTISVLFPVVEEVSAEERSPTNYIPPGSETILLVDDEEALVKMGKQMLERIGYQVDARIDPVEALDLFKQNPNRFDLVVSDMTMPKLPGDVLIKEILKIRNDIPIILCTGYSEKVNKTFKEEMGVRKYIEKPLSKKNLADAIRDVLNEDRKHVKT